MVATEANMKSQEYVLHVHFINVLIFSVPCSIALMMMFCNL